MEKYTRLTAQPFRLYFLFKTEKTGLPAPETVWAEPGSVEVKITVNNILYGPYDTGIRTTLGIYTLRRTLRPNDEMNALTQEIQTFLKFLHDAHTYLEKKMIPMDGPSMMKKAEQLRASTLN